MNWHRAYRKFKPPLRPSWRISLQSTAAELDLSEPQLVDWGGALRWLKSDDDAISVRKAARKADGHATAVLPRRPAHQHISPFAGRHVGAAPARQTGDGSYGHFESGADVSGVVIGNW